MLSCASKRSTVIMDSCRHMQPPAPWADLCNEQRDWQSAGAGLALGEGHIHQGWLPDAHFCLFEVKTLLGYHRENNYFWLDADANERKRRRFSYWGYFMFVSATVHTNSPSPNRSFWSISGPAMLAEACVDELSNTILSHTGLTSSTSDKPILFPAPSHHHVPKSRYSVPGASAGGCEGCWFQPLASPLRFKTQIKAFGTSRFLVISKCTECVWCAILVFWFI